MQVSDHASKNSPKSKRLVVKRTGANKSSKRSRQTSASPKNQGNKTSSVPTKHQGKVATPRAVPKLLISNLFSPRSPRKANPSTARSRRRSTAHNSIPGSIPAEHLVHNSSAKHIDESIPTSQLLQNSKKEASAIQEALKVWEALKVPTTASTVLQLLSTSLSKYEQSEILGYHEIYCIGIKAKKSKSKVDSKMNYGFDDERGDYKVEAGDHVAYRYEIHKVLGSGSFGQVLLAKDHKTGQECALKVIRNKTRFHQQALVEVEILKLLGEKDCNDQYNVVHIIDSLMFRKHMVFSI